MAGIAIAVLGLVTAAALGEKASRDRRTALMLESAARQADLAEPASELMPVSTAPDRPVYPYSIVEGGAASLEELREAIKTDPVVAAHYANFDLSKTRVETLTAPKLRHVSYRIGKDVFWTKAPVVIRAGERVLTDGTNLARTRCANQLAEEPGPVSDLEPPAAVLDTPAPAVRQAGIPPAGTPVSGVGPPPTQVASPGPSAFPGPAPTPTAGIPVGPGQSRPAPGPGGSGYQPPTGAPGGGNAPPLPGGPTFPPGGPSGGPGFPPGNPGNPLGPPDDPFGPGNPVVPPDNPVTPLDGPEDPGDPGDPGGPEDPQQIPEPGATLMMLAGGLWAVRRLRRR